jgi:SAM-dependent methyltransferase
MRALMKADRVLQGAADRVPTRLRFMARRLWYLPSDLVRDRSSLAPPRGLIYVGHGDFIVVGRRWRAFLIGQGLRPDHDLLDIGSGIGRIALGLTDLLTGRYEGFDAVKVGIDWSTKHITPRYPNFRFRYIALRNDAYNDGDIDASTLVFPYESDSFDFACAISVFTHMIDRELVHYLDECYRVLRPGGRFVATFFVMDEVAAAAVGAGEQMFPYDWGDYLVKSLRRPSAGVAYRGAWLDASIERAGFRVASRHPGAWSGRTDHAGGVAYQDILVLDKPAR